MRWGGVDKVEEEKMGMRGRGGMAGRVRGRGIAWRR